jgi:type I restriction enzyme S subunit
MELRPGYKSTEIGVIPQDWDARTIDEIAFVTSGKRLPLGSSLVRNPTPHPYIRVTDMRPGTVDLSEIRYVPESVFPAIKRYRIFSEDLFISVAGSLGIVGKVPEELDGANLTENADRITSITCSQDFLLHVLMSPFIQGVIDSIQTVGAQPKLALTRIRKFVVPQPPLPEQRAIAAALSDMDALLAGLDRLITKKRGLKRAAMQQLLTGQTRLPGFQGEWEAKRLGDLAELNRQNVVPASQPDQPFVHFSLPAFDSGRGAQIELGATIGSNKFGVPSNAVLLSKLNPRIPRVWAPESVPINACASTEWLVLTPRPATERRFLFVLCTSPTFSQQMELAATGTTGSHQRISPATALDIRLQVPIDKDEQAAISTVLSDMDAELTALEARRDKTRALKQAMMQELLTGRTRLV